MCTTTQDNDHVTCSEKETLPQEAFGAMASLEVFTINFNITEDKANTNLTDPACKSLLRWGESGTLVGGGIVVVHSVHTEGC